VLFCASVIGGAGCYALEYANRVAFLERRRLAEACVRENLPKEVTPMERLRKQAKR
jgi:hypothetical protein